MKKITIIIIFLFSLFYSKSYGQNVIEIQPLFEYPVAPEELESLEDKCNYLVKNFWNNFDFKKKEPVDQYALNAAFEVYVTTFRFASEKELTSSLDKLIKNISSNPVLLMQFCKAAEENLYGMRADYWSDEIYLKFLDAVLKNKKIAPNRKTRYAKQEKALSGSLIGQPAPNFDFMDQDNQPKKYFAMSTPTMLIFGDPEDTDWRLARIKMDSNSVLDDALKKGKVNILFIVTNNSGSWVNNISNYNKYWTIGKSEDVANVYDIRMLPSIYLIDSSGKIINKNLNPETATSLLLQLVN